MTDEEIKKMKAIDLNTESLKLYVTIAIGSIAGLIAYHNSPNIIHNNIWFFPAIGFLLVCAILGLSALNSQISAVDAGEINVNKKVTLRLNFLAIICCAFGITFGVIYFITSKAKQSTEKPLELTQGIMIEGNKVSIGKDVKTHIKITKDSSGTIREIIIP